MSGTSRKRGPAKATSRTASEPRRKNFILDQARIDRARKALGAATETETITRALDAVIDLDALQREAVAAIEPLLGKSKISNYFDDPAALDWSGFEKKKAPARRERPKSHKRA